MIRDALPEDFDRILDLCGEFWKHTLYTEPFDRDHTLNMVNMAYDHDLLLVAGDCAGFMAAVKAPLLGSSVGMQAIEVAWYVDPDARNGRYGIGLIKRMEDKVKEQGIKYWNMISMESSMPEKINSMYEKMSYNRSETTFTKVF